MKPLVRLLSSVVFVVAVTACQSDSAESADSSAGNFGDSGDQIGETTAELVLAPITPNSDTTLRSGAPFANDGTGVTLGVTAASIADVKRSLVRFSQAQITSVIPVGQVLYSARLDMKVVGLSAGWLGGAVDILPMTRDWPEGNGLLGHGPSWVCADDTNTTLLGNLANNCSAANNWSMLPTGPYPRPFSPTATDRAPVFTGGLSTISFDVTADVQRYLNGAPNYGWMLAGAANLIGGQWVNFGSRTAAASSRPALILEVGVDQCPTDPNKGVPGACGCGTPDLDTNLDNVADCFDAVATATGDTTLRLAATFANDGTGTLLGVTSASVIDLERSLVQVSNAAINTARNGRKIKRAYLELTVAGVAFGWAGGTLELSRMNRTWAEGNGLAGHGASWACADDTNTTLLGNLVNNCAASNNWGMQLFNPFPRPFVATPSATSSVVWPGLTTVRFDVTSDVEQFVNDPSGVAFPNHGWIVQGAASSLLSGSFVNFGSRESGAPPRLLFDLDPECPPSGRGDADTDGVLDCNDFCPNDGEKSEPGACGCNRPETDADNDRIPNCIDPCPFDNDPTLGGQCGCPSGSAAPAGTPCVGACGGSGNTTGVDTCDGQGQCGDPSSCPPPVTGCTTCVPIVTTQSVYWYCPCGRDQTTATQSCDSVPGQGLAQVTDASDNAWLRARITGDTWLAASDSAQEGEWRWSRDGNGAQFWEGNASGAPHYNRYNNWASGEPSDAAPNLDCGAMSFAGPDGEWRARNCSDSLHVLCVRPFAGLPPLDPDGEPPPTGCERQGNCPPPDNGQCIDVADIPAVVPGACAFGDPDERCDAQRAAEAQLQACDDCTATNAACTGSSATPAGCEAACAGSCTGAAAANAPGTATCAPFDDHLDPDVEVHCTLEAATATACVTHADCIGQAPDSRHCGRIFVCVSDGNPVNPTDGDDCTPEQDPNAGPRAEVCTGSNDECVARFFCGTPIDECLIEDTDTEPCTEYDLCLDPANDFLPTPPANATDLETPQTLKPEEVFEDSDEPAVNLVEFPEDGPCPDGSYGCAPSANESHRWCRYELDPAEHLDERNAPPVNNRTNAGAGERLSFAFDPSLALHYDMQNGPLGLPLPNISASAQLKADAHIELFSISKHVDIIDVGIGAHAGLQADLRANILAPPDPNAICGFKSDSHAKILSIDVLPVGNASNISIPSTATQQRCVTLVQAFTRKVDRARKAFADARELIRQYQALKLAGTNFRNGSGGMPSLCSVIAATPPAGFPSFGYTCATEPPEVTIDRFVWYYNQVVLPQVRTSAGQLADELDDWSNAQSTWPLTTIDELEEITIFNQTFMVGPIPVNLEVTMPVSYGLQVSVDARFQIGTLMNQLVIGQTRSADDPFAKIGVVGTPHAGAGIALFAGVGFDIGFASAKIGIEGVVDLGDVGVPTNAYAGIGLTPVADDRELPLTWRSFVDVNQDPLIPNQVLKFGLFYGYGAQLAINHVLDGQLNAKLKLKFFWFSRTYRKRIVRFTGFCATDGRPRQGWCDVTLFESGPSNAWDWGTLKMPMPFLPLQYLPLDNGRPFTAAYNPGPAGELFYNSLCQCIPSFPPNTVVPEDFRCSRNEDCCPGLFCRSTTGTCEPEIR